MRMAKAKVLGMPGKPIRVQERNRKNRPFYEKKKGKKK